MTLSALLADERYEGKMEGLTEGKAEGKTEGQQQIIGNMLAQDLTFEQISKYTGLALAEVKELAVKATPIQ